MSSETKILDLSGSFIINDSSRMQSVYSSQNYGTFYEVYALCNFENNLLKSIDLKLVNYKGPINIGFLNESNGECKLKFDSKSKTICLILVVKGLGNCDFTTVTTNENIHIDKIAYWNTLRVLKPLSTDNKGLENNVFDEEYYYRSGTITTLDPRKKRDGLIDTKLTLQKNIESIDFSDAFPSSRGIPKGSAGGKCYSSKIRCVKIP